MKKTALLLSILLGLTHITFGQKNHWVSLFDGKTLNGWNQKNGKAKFSVVNGEIIGETVANTPNSFLCTDKDYSDFILELELKVDNSMNSGIQFRSLSKPDYQNGRVHGYQMEVDPSDRAWSGGIYDEGRREWLYIPNINPEGKKAFKNNDWNKYRIEAIGSTLRTWINGIPVANLVDDLTPSGFIALQVHAIHGDDMKEGMKIRWRNIRIQTGNLKPRPNDNIPIINLLPNNLSAQEQAQGVKLLFNGKDFTGWRALHKNIMTDKRWSVSDGEIHIAASDGSQTGNDIVTVDQYSAFELTFDFKLTEGANSGVKYFVNEALDSSASGIGLEFQLLDDERHPDAKLGAVGNRTLASLYDLIPSYKLQKRFQRKITDWQNGRIVVYQNNIVQHWLNGFKVVEYERKSNIFDALVARSKYAHYKGFGAADKGPILLQDHGESASFRNIKIRELK